MATISLNYDSKCITYKSDIIPMVGDLICAFNFEDTDFERHQYTVDKRSLHITNEATHLITIILKKS